MKNSIITAYFLITILCILQSTFTIAQLIKSEDEYLNAFQEINEQKRFQNVKPVIKYQGNSKLKSAPKIQLNSTSNLSSKQYERSYLW